MDLSKLPKLSGNRDTDKTPDGVQANPASESLPPAATEASSAPASAPARVARAHEPPYVGPDALLALVIGAVLMMVGRGFAEWAIATLRGQVYDAGYTWREGPNAGQIVPYWQCDGCLALSESSVFLFGLALAVGGLVLLSTRVVPRGWKPLLLGAWLVMLLATMYNAAAIVVLLRNDITPIWATLLTGLGAYEVWMQWRTLRELA